MTHLQSFLSKDWCKLMFIKFLCLRMLVYLILPQYWTWELPKQNPAAKNGLSCKVFGDSYTIVAKWVLTVAQRFMLVEVLPTILVPLRCWNSEQPLSHSFFLPCSCWQNDRKALYCCALYYYYLKTRQWLSISDRSLNLKMTICLSLYEWALSGASWSTLSGSSGPFVQSTKPNLIDLALPVRLQSQ